MSLCLHIGSPLAGECIAGAMQWRDLMKTAIEVGFSPPVLVKSVLFETGETDDPEVQKLVGMSIDSL